MSEPLSSVGFIQDVLLRNRSCETHCSWGKGSWSMAHPPPPPIKVFNFVLSEVASGGFLHVDSRRLVAEMLLHVEIHLA